MNNTIIDCSENGHFQSNGTQNYSVFDSNLAELEWIFKTIDRLVLPAVTVGGLLLQSLNVLVLLNKHLRSNAIRFLVAMNLVDVLFLLVQLPFLLVPYIAHEGANAAPTAFAYNEFVQQFYDRFVLYPISHVCRATNTWLAVLVSFERCLALRPKCSWTCTSRYSVSRRKLSMPAIIATVLLAATLNMCCFFKNPNSVNRNSRTSTIRELDVDVLKGIVAVVRFALTYLLPLVLLLVFNTSLVFLLIQYRHKHFCIKRAKGFQVSSNRSNSSGNNFRRNRCCSVSQIGRERHLRNTRKWTHRLSRSTLNIAVMVLVTTFVHLFLEAPGTALKLFVLLAGQAVIRANSWLILASHASNVLIFMHCSIDWCALFWKFIKVEV